DPAVYIAANHFVDQRHQNACAAGSDRMPDGDCASVHVYFFGIEAELTHHPEGLNGEGFVQLVEINVFVLPAGLLPYFPDGTNRRHHDPFGIDAAGSLSNDADHWLRPKSFRLGGAGHNHGRCPIIHSGSIARGAGPTFVESGFTRTKSFD